MSFPERPPLHRITCEQIDQLLHKVDERHWPQITAMRVKSHYPLDTPVPPQAPEHLRQEIHWYASMLFKTEADQYNQFRSDVRYKGWLSGLADRTRARVMKALDNLESNGTNFLEKAVGVQGALILGYHGLTTQEVEKELRTMLSELCDQYEREAAASLSSVTKDDYVKAGVDVSSASPLLKMALAAAPGIKTSSAKQKRISALIHSPSAAAKMEAFRKSKGLNQTQLAIRAQTTDKTIRKFRQTGHIKPSILDGIAEVMGVTKEELLS